MALQRSSLITTGHQEKDQSIIPVPPPAPETVAKGFNSEGYWQLIQSLPLDERSKILAKLKSSDIIARAKLLDKAAPVSPAMLYQPLKQDYV